VYVERGGKLFLTNAKFRSEDHLRRIIERIVTKVGRRIARQCDNSPSCSERGVADDP
jgi:Flp pilus assembly CpaF family ATPase